MKCKNATSDSDRIICRGYCKKSFHMSCVRMDLSFRDYQKSNEKNVLWMCDDCADLFLSDPFRNLSLRCIAGDAPEEVSLNSLKDDISELKGIVKTLSSKVDGKAMTPVASTPWSGFNRMLSPSNVPNTPKRKRVDSQPKEKASIIRGSKAASEMVKTVSPPEELFWLYLSAFDPSTSDDDITTFVKNCMDLPPDVMPKVVKLVPRDKDPATLSFVTFKVGLKKSLKDMALSKETWPENVYFREFESQPKNQRRVVRVIADKNPLDRQ